MNDDDRILTALHEIRDGQREIASLLSRHYEFVESQAATSKSQLTESIGLQRSALQRVRTITMIAVPGILACIAAIAYLVLTYF